MGHTCQEHVWVVHGRYLGAGIVLTVSGKLPVAALCSSYAQPGLLDIRKNQANGNISIDSDV